MLALENGQKDLYHQLLERLVPADHVYRKLDRLLDFKELLVPLHELYSNRILAPQASEINLGELSLGALS